MRHDNETNCGIWNFKKREDLRRKLREEPCDDSVRDRCAVNIAPLQFGQKFRWIHSARVDEALVTAALYLDARDLESVRNIQSKRATRPFSALKAATV